MLRDITSSAVRESGKNKSDSAKALMAVKAPLVPLVRGALHAVNERAANLDASVEALSASGLISLLDAVRACIQILAESTLQKILQTPIEQWVDAAIHALTVWLSAIERQQTMLLLPLAQIAIVSLNEFSKLCRVSTNQRKVIQT
jgi:hypothetical protein